MIKLITFLLCSYGIMFTLKDSKLPILQPVRRYLVQKHRYLTNLFTCSFCLGFHTGWITYLLFFWKNISRGTHSLFEILVRMIVFGFVSATFCFAFDTFIVYLEGKVRNE